MRYNILILNEFRYHGDKVTKNLIKRVQIV